MRTLLISTENNELKEKYTAYIETHNQQVYTSHPNAGFDLFTPHCIISNDDLIKVDMEIVASMIEEDNDNCSFYLYPRSSISKTKLRIANSVGIIDSGYRGNIIGVFDNNGITACIEKNSRLLQICSGDLQPFLVKICDNIELLGSSSRGTGGFGSTGI